MRCRTVNYFDDGMAILCRADAVRGDELCYYDRKVRDGLLEPAVEAPPGDGGTGSGVSYKLVGGEVIWERRRA